MRYLFKKLIVSANTKIYRNLKTSSTMANTNFEYVKNMERKKLYIPNCWTVVKVDGAKFSKFSKVHKFSKPNDIRALKLMNCAAASVMNEFSDVVMAYGQSDEYSFVFRKETKAYNPRNSELMECLDSVLLRGDVRNHFSMAYRDEWSKFFSIPLKYPPTFNARVGRCSSDETWRDSLKSQQVKVHENNLYNTCFWNLVQKKNMTPEEAHKTLKRTVSSEKKELLLHTFNINYNDEPEMFRKGSTLIKKLLPDDNGELKSTVITLTCDLMEDKFWEENPQILEPKALIIKTNGGEKNKTNGGNKKKTNGGNKNKTNGVKEDKFEYLRRCRHEKICPPDCWIVVNIDGAKFSKFSKIHKFSKPNDIRALQLMNRAADSVVRGFPDIVLAYGQSDEYSFVFRKETQAYNRRVSSFVANVASRFSSAFTFHWLKFFSIPMKYPVNFGSSVFVFPSDENLRDYVSWRQADVHENNLYNTCFWNLVQKKNMTPAQAQEALKGTVSSDKHELLLHTFNMNYNDENEMFRYGSTLIKKRLSLLFKYEPTVITLTHGFIGDEFWEENSHIFEPKVDKNKINELKKNSAVKVKIPLRKSKVLPNQVY